MRDHGQPRADMARPDNRQLLPHLACPLLMARGEADALTPPEHVCAIAAAAPPPRLEIVPGAGHMLTLEQPAQVNALLLDWLAGLAASGDRRLNRRLNRHLIAGV